MTEEIQQTSEKTETERINLAQFELAKKIQENRSKYLVMNQVPSKTRERFDELSKEEFDGHYGFTLQRLLDMYDGLCRTGHEEIFIALEEISQKMAYLQQQLNDIKDKKEPEKKGIWENRRKQGA